MTTGSTLSLILWQAWGPSSCADWDLGWGGRVCRCMLLASRWTCWRGYSVIPFSLREKSQDDCKPQRKIYFTITSRICMMKYWFMHTIGEKCFSRLMHEVSGLLLLHNRSNKLVMFERLRTIYLHTLFSCTLENFAPYNSRQWRLLHWNLRGHLKRVTTPPGSFNSTDKISPRDVRLEDFHYGQTPSSDWTDT
jgi:hypothetical protein